MEEEYIDVRNTRQQYERALIALDKDQAISRRNRQLLKTFLRDASLGKTVANRAKKKIGPARLVGYIHQMYQLILFLGKDLDKINQDDMENFIEALENDRILSRRSMANMPSGKVLSKRYQLDIKFTLRKFYKWLWGGNKTYPPIVEWIDTYFERKEVPALTEAEVQRMLDIARSMMQKALIQTLFDGGFRIGELLNIRLRHTRMMSFDPRDPKKRCFALRVPFSKTLRRTVLLPMEASSKWLELWLDRHPAHPEIQQDGTIQATNIEMQLFPLTDNAVRLMVRRLGREALGKRVYPHLMRHTSATFWSNRLPYFKFCKRFGWIMTSNMPQRYIDREGIDEMAVAQIYHRQEHEQRRSEPDNTDVMPVEQDNAQVGPRLR